MRVPEVYSKCNPGMPSLLERAPSRKTEIAWRHTTGPLRHAPCKLDASRTTWMRSGSRASRDWAASFLHRTHRLRTRVSNMLHASLVCNIATQVTGGPAQMIWPFSALFVAFYESRQAKLGALPSTCPRAPPEPLASRISSLDAPVQGLEKT
jgi:hypothetical protein